MSAGDQSPHDGMAATPVQDHRKLMTGPQGEALIVELRKAKAAVDRLRQNARTNKQRRNRLAAPVQSIPAQSISSGGFRGRGRGSINSSRAHCKSRFGLIRKTSVSTRKKSREEVLAATGEQSERVAAPGGRSVTSVLAPAI